MLTLLSQPIHRVINRVRVILQGINKALEVKGYILMSKKPVVVSLMPTDCFQGKVKVKNNDTDWAMLLSKRKASWKSPLILYEDPFALHPHGKLNEEVANLFKRRHIN